MVNGKPVRLADHKAELVAEGLTVTRDELRQMVADGKKPAGTPTKIGNTLVYPTPHFA